MAKADPETPDEILVVAAMAGDFDAFDALTVRYRQGVIRIAQAIVGPLYAEDVAQDALLLAFKALPSLEEPEKFPAWLYAIARHRAFRFDRHERARRKTQIAFDELLLESIPALARPVVEVEKREELHVALERISPDHALVLRLHFLDEMPLKRIAAFLGISLATVKWRVHQGKKLIRKCFRQRQRKKRQWKESKS